MLEIISRVVDCHTFIRRDSQAQYLLLHRASDKIYANSWRMVGGKIEEGETAYAAAIRELQEETGLSAHRLWAVPYVNSFYEASHNRINMIPVFAAEVSSDAVTLSAEHDNYEWLSYDEAQVRLLWPAQKEGLRIVHDFIAEDSQVAGFVEIELE